MIPYKKDAGSKSDILFTVNLCLFTVSILETVPTPTPAIFATSLIPAIFSTLSYYDIKFPSSKFVQAYTMRYLNLELVKH